MGSTIEFSEFPPQVAKNRAAIARCLSFSALSQALRHWGAGPVAPVVENPTDSVVHPFGGNPIDGNPGTDRSILRTCMVEWYGFHI